MKTLLLIIFILLTTNLQAERINLDNYFDVVNRTLKIHKLSDNEFLLYGDKGGVVRSYDAGGTWEQNYAATKSNIVSMVNHKEYVIGATVNGELIYSADKGNQWDVNIIDIKPTKLVASNDLLFATEGNNTIFISSDMGERWTEKLVTDFPINELLFLKGKLFVSTQNYELFYSTDLGESWSKIELPDGMNGNQQHSIQINDDELFIRGITSIYRINDNLVFDVIASSGYFNKYIVEGDSIHYFVGDPNTRMFEYRNSKLDDTNTVTHFDYHNPSFNPASYFLTDVMKSDSILIMTSFGKGILRSSDYGKTWEVVSHFPMFDGNSDFKFFNEDEWNYNGQYFSINTYNAGATFLSGKDYTIDTTNGSEFRSFIRSNYWITEDSVVYFLDKQFSNSTLSNAFTSNNHGKDLIPANTDFPKDLNVLHRDSEGNIYLSKSISTSGAFKNKFRIYKLSEDFKVDTIKLIDSVDDFSFLKVFNFKDNNYLCYPKEVDESGSVNFTILQTDQYFNTFEEVVSVAKPENLFVGTNSIFISEKGYLFFNFYKEGKSINYRVNLVSTELKQINETNVFWNPWESGFVDNSILMSHYKLYDAKGDSTIDKYRAVKVMVDDNGDLKLDTVLNDNRGYSFDKAGDDNILIGKQSILRPIEKDRLTSIAIESKTEAIGIWPFYPIPNPAKERVKVLFYTEVSENIANLEIELVNISTGVKYNINEYNLQFLDNWDGSLDFDISAYPAGSYLINMRLGDYQKNTKLIISR